MTAVNAAGAPLCSAPPPPRRAADVPHPEPAIPGTTSPSTVQASPSSTPHPVSYSNISAGRVKTSDAPTKLRARLACRSCRKSKIRCGPLSGEERTPCPQCAKSGKICLWPDDGTDTTTARNPSISAGFDAPPAERSSESRKRKKVAPSASFDKPLLAEGGIYNPHLYSDAVWEELYAIFRCHYATELPFLHGVTFLEELRQITSLTLPGQFAPLLLAFLSLTVPFHKEIQRQLSKDPREIARRYADAAEARIDFQVMAAPTIHVPQALLMLSLRAHGDAQGSKSFILLGLAIKTMQLLGCHFDKELDDKNKSTARQETRDSMSMYEDRSNEEVVKHRVITDEIHRRTFWSCFIIDRYISSGDFKPRSVQLDDNLVLVQLPCSEDRFDLGLKTKTRMLRETDDEFNDRREKHLQGLEEGRQADEKHHRGYPTDVNSEWENEDKQSPLVWFIKALDLYGDVMRYGTTVTRRYDTIDPWIEGPPDVQLNFYKLDKRVDRLISRLPEKLKLSPSVTNVEIHHRRSTPYVLLHSTLCICKIALHREYFPFITWPKSPPKGPVDGPRWEHLRDASIREAPDFWKNSARSCFRATRECFDLLAVCRQRGALVETPLTAWICFNVVFTIMWTAFYPNMDEDGVICRGRDRPDSLVVENFEQGFEILRHLQARMILARTLCTRLHTVLAKLMRLRSNYNNPEGSPTERYVTESLKEYLEWEKEHKQFGDEVTDADYTAFVELPNLRGLLDAFERNKKSIDSAHGTSVVNSELKSEDGASVQGTPDSGSVPLHQRNDFTPVNAKTYGSSISNSSYIAPSPTSQTQYQLPSHGTAMHGIPSYHETFAPNNIPRQEHVSPRINSYPMIGKDQVTTSTVSNHPNHLDYLSAATEVYAATPHIAPQISNCYPGVPWSEYGTMNDQSYENIAAFTGNDFSHMPNTDFYPPAPLQPTFYSGN